LLPRLDCPVVIIYLSLIMYILLYFSLSLSFCVCFSSLLFCKEMIELWERKQKCPTISSRRRNQESRRKDFAWANRENPESLSLFRPAPPGQTNNQIEESEVKTIKESFKVRTFLLMLRPPIYLKEKKFIFENHFKTHRERWCLSLSVSLFIYLKIYTSTCVFALVPLSLHVG
jgi:hypothetical protein